MKLTLFSGKSGLPIKKAVSEAAMLLVCLAPDIVMTTMPTKKRTKDTAKSQLRKRQMLLYLEITFGKEKVMPKMSAKTRNSRKGTEA